jgi:hypothetical protein
VPAVVIALITTNALAHLVASHLVPVSVPLVVAVSAIAPLVLYRVKALSAPLAPQRPARAPDIEPAPERPSGTPTAPPIVSTPDPLIADARAFVRQVQRDTGKAPTLRALQSHLRVGQQRAQRIRVQLAASAA